MRRAAATRPQKAPMKQATRSFVDIGRVGRSPEHRIKLRELTSRQAFGALGGKLDAPKEVEPGEWRSPRIIDGKTYEITKGDLVIVPRGTPHQRSTANQNFTMILIKIYAEPLKKRP